MIMYYNGQPVVLVREDDAHRVTVRLGGGEEVTVPKETVTDSFPVWKEGSSAAPTTVGEPGTGVSSDGRPFPSSKHVGD